MLTVGQEMGGLDMQALLKVRGGYFQAKLLVLLLLTAALSSLTVLAPGALWIIPSVLLGLAFAHAVELQHQCLHNTAYHSRFLNRMVGVLLGVPLFVSYSDYQNSHLKHHRLLGTPEDKEFFNYSYQKLTSLAAFIPHLWMVRHYMDIGVYILKSVFGQLVREKEATLKTARRIRSEYILMALFLGGMGAITVIFQTPIFLKLWVLPFLIGVPTHALIELPEHMGCNVHTPNVLENTRTIKAGRIVVWFVDGNNYHVEHHWLAGVPNDKFPVLHTHLAHRIIYFEESYFSFYRQFLRNLWNKNLHRPWKPEGERKRYAAAK
jgi:fatty acid desaturase